MLVGLKGGWDWREFAGILHDSLLFSLGFGINDHIALFQLFKRRITRGRLKVLID